MEPTSKAKVKASFAWLLRDALTSVGIRYLTPEHIRVSKTSSMDKNSQHSSLCSLLWRALHDICMVVVSNFDIDPVALATESQALSDEPNGLDVCIDVSRYYLYDWGFLCSEFYTTPRATEIAGSIMVTALAFVMAHSDFFSHQALAILRLQLTDDTIILPPFPNEPSLQPHHCDNAVANTILLCKQTVGYQAESRPNVTQLVHRIHATYGKMQYKLKELQALEQSKTKCIQRIHDTQLKNLGSVILMDKSSVQESILSPYHLWLLRHPEKLRLHQECLEKRLANYADEKLFYQWILAIATQLRQAPSASHVETESPTSPDNFSELLAAATAANECFQSSKDVYRVVSKQWKEISASEKARQKPKLEKATMSMQAELPSMNVLYLPISYKEKKAVEASPPPPQTKTPETAHKAFAERQVQALVSMFEQRFGVRLV
ncbi:Aste57867_21659 [Aphanomyces stellatus]|uniref:Aste57867_21659 protein n=1 Tax=Aphanomyces stellatus TaxID=120398 RepID=A0A485LIT0_9STRA|nr:hypothetical protein As57867_021590 [Aphanomyces stellatus]VFT98328.1 Aste57867_21659 [Aphanomyces stellatus]